MSKPAWASCPECDREEIYFTHVAHESVNYFFSPFGEARISTELIDYGPLLSLSCSACGWTLKVETDPYSNAAQPAIEDLMTHAHIMKIKENTNE